MQILFLTAAATKYTFQRAPDACPAVVAARTARDITAGTTAIVTAGTRVALFIHTRPAA